MLQGIFAPYTSRIARPAQLLDFADMTSFTFMRDPVARLLSLYKEKVTQSLHPPLAAVGVRREMDFGAFVETLSAVPDREADDHFRSQSAMIAEDGRVFVDLVAPVARLDQIMPVVLAIAGVAWAGPRFHHRRTDAEQSRALVDAATLATLRRRYAEDFDLFQQVTQAPLLSDRLPEAYREGLALA